MVTDGRGRPADYSEPDVTLRVDKIRKQTTKEKLFAGRYRFVKKLGEGGMGKVLLMHDDVGRKDVAVKLFKDDGALNVEHFRREADILQKLRHDRIVGVMDFNIEEYEDRDGIPDFITEGKFAISEHVNVNGVRRFVVPYFVMQYIEGGFTLAEYLDRQGGTISPEKTIEILRPIAEALDYAHRQQPEIGKPSVIHRDVKPANIILQDIGNGRLSSRLLDFGIAKPVDGTEYTTTVDACGTVGYMAPERIGRKGRSELSDDIYGFAAVAYRCLTGNVPAIPEVCNRRVPRPSGSSPFIDAVLRGLSPEPGERPRHCMEFFEGVLRHDGGVAPQGASGKGRHFPGFMFALDASEFVWNNDEHKPKVVITPPDQLVEDTDFTIQYEDNRDVGMANVAVVGLTRKWKGCWEDLPFKIVPRSISKVAVDDIAPLVYSGRPVFPKVRVEDKDLGKVLEFDKDYWVKVELRGDGEAGEATIQIIGMGNYAGEVRKTFLVMPRNIADTDITLQDHPEYTGQPARPGIAVRDVVLGRTLQMGRDYSVEYGDDVDKEGWLRVVGAGNYEGTVVVPFKIHPRNIGHATLTAPQDVRFDGKPVASIPVKVFDDELGCELENGVDFHVEFRNANTPGDAVVCAKGFGGHYCGEVTRGFRISKGVFDVAVDRLSQRNEYDGRPHGLNVVVRNAPSAMTVSYARSKNGPYARDPVTVRDVCGETPIWFRVERDGYETYSGVGTVEIVTRSVDHLTIKLVADQPFAGRAVCPALSVQDPALNADLVRGRDFELQCSGNGDVGQACVKVVGRGNYTGQRDCPFKILPKGIGVAEVLAIPDQEYDGTPKHPEVSVRDVERDCVLVKDRDYRLAYRSDEYVGTGIVQIVGMGNYTGTKEMPFQITPRNLSKTTIAPVPPVKYGGSPVKDVDVEIRDKVRGYTLRRGKDYEVQCRNADRPGKAVLVVVGHGTYCGKLTTTLEIQDGEFTLPVVSGFIGEYDGQLHGITVSPVAAPQGTRIAYALGKDEPYGSHSPSFKDVGEWPVWFRLTCEGYTPFYGKATVVVRPRQLTRKSMAVGVVAPVFNGRPVIPDLEVKDRLLAKVLVQDVDYSLEAKKADRPGFGRVVITGIGNYAGSIVTEFVFRKLRAISAENVVFQWPASSGVVSAIVSDAKSGRQLKLGKDFQLEVRENCPVEGWQEAHVTGCGDYEGEVVGRHMRGDRRFESLLSCLADIRFSVQKTDGQTSLVKLKADVKGRCIELTDLLGRVTVDLNGFCIDSGKNSPFRLVHDEDEMQRLGFSGDFPKVGTPPSEWGDCATNLRIVNSRPGGTSGVYCKCDVLVSVDRGVSWMTAFAVDDGVVTGRKVP